MILFAFVAAGYSFTSTDYWTASQPMVLRDEAVGAVDRLGRFGSQTDLKAAQETILEMARNHEVVRAALKQVGPYQKFFSIGTDSNYPSNEIVAAIAKKRVNIRAPQGGEFGGSEMIYLQVEDRDPARAVAFCESLYAALAQQMRDVRRVRADSMIVELTHARDLASRNLDEASRRMQLIEINFGSDLGELRNLTETLTGDGANRRELEENSRDIQAAELVIEKLQSFYQLLEQGQRDPNHLLVSGGDALSHQQSLQRLKDGLIDAQLARAKLAGRVTALHPKMKAAVAAEGRIRAEMQSETVLVMQAMEPVLRVESDRLERLKLKRGNIQRRLDRLAEARTEYATISADVKHRTTLLEEAERVLTAAEATRSASLSVNLLSKLGPVTSANSPNGMSTSMLTAGGAAAGLIFGLGTVFLVAPGPNQSRFGRRWSDMLSGRRSSDRVPSTTASTTPQTPEGHGSEGRDRRRRSPATDATS